MIVMESHVCPCCMRMVQTTRELGFEPHLSYPEDSHGTTEELVNHNDPFSMLNNFEMTSISYNKLLAFLHERERKKIDNQIYDEANNLPLNPINKVNFVFNDDLSLLTRKPTHRANLYTDSSQFPVRPSTFYQNYLSADISNLVKVFQTVENCPWYWSNLSNQEAHQVLENSTDGCFILRNSSDKRYLFSLSTVTKIGISSIRIVYSNGKFEFETDKPKKSRSLSDPFPKKHKNDSETCVLNLILKYTKFLRKENLSSSGASCATDSGSKPTEKYNAKRSKSNSEKFVCSWKSEGSLKKFQIDLKSPQRKTFPSLKELSRFAVNKRFSMWEDPSQTDNLNLPHKLKDYIKSYPYPI